MPRRRAHGGAGWPRDVVHPPCARLPGVGGRGAASGRRLCNVPSHNRINTLADLRGFRNGEFYNCQIFQLVRI